MDKLSNNLINKILFYLDKTSEIETRKIKLFNNILSNYTTSIERRILMLKYNTNITKIESQNIDIDKFYNIIYLIVDILYEKRLLKKKIFEYNIVDYDFNNKVDKRSYYLTEFIIELLKTKIFYIGGSFALLFKYILSNNYDFDNFNDVDIDIYVIGNVNDKTVEEKLKHIINTSLIFKQCKCTIEIKNFVSNFYFKDTKIPKIQFILHIRKDINLHIEFIDLPITHYTLGYKTLYYTKLADYAFNNKINIIDSISNDITHNSILKYINRNYTTVMCSIYGYNEFNLDNLRIISIYFSCNDILYEYYTDCFLNDILNVFPYDDHIIIKTKDKEISSKIINSKIICIEKKVIINNISSENKLFNKMLNNNLLEYNVLNLQVKYMSIYSIKYNLSYEEYNIYYKHGIINYNRKKKIYYRNYKKSYKYRDDESKHCFSYYKKITNKIKSSNNCCDYIKKYYLMKRRRFYPYFFPLSIKQFIKIKTHIFFDYMCSYFLNNHMIKKTINNNYTSINSEAVEQIIRSPNWIIDNYNEISDTSDNTDTSDNVVYND